MILAKLFWGTDLSNAYLLIGSTENNTHPETGSHYCTKKKGGGEKRKGKEKKKEDSQALLFLPVEENTSRFIINPFCLPHVAVIAVPHFVIVGIT